MLRELLCIWTDWESLNGWNFLEDIYIKFRETELVEISQVPRVWSHGSLRMQGCRDELKSTSTNGFNFRITNSFMVSYGVRFTWLDCNDTIYVAELFLVHRLWRNKLTRLLVSMIKMIGINCPTLVVSNKSRTWRAFRFVNFCQLTFFPPRRSSFCRFEVWCFINPVRIQYLTAEPSQYTKKDLKFRD